MRRFYGFWWRCRERPRRAAKSRNPASGRRGVRERKWRSMAGADTLRRALANIERGVRALACVDIAVLVDDHVNRGADGVPHRLRHRPRHRARAAAESPIRILHPQSAIRNVYSLGTERTRDPLTSLRAAVALRDV